jgi:hypothetical protein
MNAPSRELRRRLSQSLVATAALSALLACGGGDQGDAASSSAASADDKAFPLGRVVVVTSYGANAVTYWYDVALKTINQPAAPSGTPEERMPLLTSDMSTLLVAIYDSVISIDGARQPFNAAPTTPAAGASMDAAAAAAAYRVLSSLFPSRSAAYQAPYDAFVAAIANGDAKTRGLAVSRPATECQSAGWSSAI